MHSTHSQTYRAYFTYFVESPYIITFPANRISWMSVHISCELIEQTPSYLSIYLSGWLLFVGVSLFSIFEIMRSYFSLSWLLYPFHSWLHQHEGWETAHISIYSFKLVPPNYYVCCAFVVCQLAFRFWCYVILCCCFFYTISLSVFFPAICLSYELIVFCFPLIVYYDRLLFNNDRHITEANFPHWSFLIGCWLC